MTAPAGANVGIYVDMAARLETGDVLETPRGRRYLVAAVRVQLRGTNAGRQHLRAVVLGADDPLPTAGTLYAFRWYARKRRSR